MLIFYKTEKCKKKGCILKNVSESELHIEVFVKLRYYEMRYVYMMKRG